MAFVKDHRGELWAEGVRLADIAERFGTPTYVYSRAELSARYRAYADALGEYPGRICYAVKANSNLAVLSVLAQLGAGFDIVSLGELERVRAAGGDPAKVVFSGVGKTPAEMAAALRAGVGCFNVESEPELEALSRVATAEGLTAAISLRVNPDVDAGTHPYISTGLRNNKFGIDYAGAVAAYQRAADLPGLRITGVDCHIGSQLLDTAPLMDALDRLLALVDALKGVGIELEHLDLGGGVGVSYRGETPPAVGPYVQQVIERVRGRGLGLMFEPGRSIAAPAGVLLTRTLYLKRTPHKNFAVVDAAMNDLLRPSLYGAWQAIEPVVPRDGASESWDVVGPVCETGDFLGKDRELTLAEGDLLAVRGAGAYGFVMSSNYNTRPRAAEILVDGEQVHLARAREQLADLWRGEVPLSP